MLEFGRGLHKLALNSQGESCHLACESSATFGSIKKKDLDDRPLLRKAFINRRSGIARLSARSVDIRTNQRIGSDSFAIDPSIVPINQPLNMLCWAVAGAMLISWRDRVSYTLAAAIQQVGNEWVQRLNNNEGLTLDQMAGFTRAVGLRGEQSDLACSDSDGHS